MIKFEINSKNNEEFLEKIKSIAETLSDRDIRTLMRAIADTAKDSAQDRISRTKTDPDGNRWPELADKTKRARVKKGRRADDILQFTGALKASIRTEIRSDFEVAIGSDLPYAEVHQEGSDKNNIPKRQYLGLSTSDEQEILEEVDAFLERLFK